MHHIRTLSRLQKAEKCVKWGLRARDLKSQGGKKKMMMGWGGEGSIGQQACPGTMPGPGPMLPVKTCVGEGHGGCLMAQWQ